MVRACDYAGERPLHRSEGRCAMSKVWAWIFGIAIALCLLGLMA
jgi:hypothetical protein